MSLTYKHISGNPILTFCPWLPPSQKCQEDGEGHLSWLVTKLWSHREQKLLLHPCRGPSTGPARDGQCELGNRSDEDVAGGRFFFILTHLRMEHGLGWVRRGWKKEPKWKAGCNHLGVQGQASSLPPAFQSLCTWQKMVTTKRRLHYLNLYHLQGRHLQCSV